MPPTTPLLSVLLVPLLSILLVLLVPLLALLLTPPLVRLVVVAAWCGPPGRDIHSASHGSVQWRLEALPVLVNEVVFVVMLRH